ncbi:MAG: sensor histidine kinase [Pelagimonas sp.]|uniref:sensor histidine kinase n=1 Tax=Pelagimonas sp. TaxID=2073170 RepID=UPI003D6AF65E
MNCEHRQEIDRLLQTEYGEPAELSLRFCGLVVGTIVLHLYTGWSIAWLWPLGFFLAHALYYGFLKTRNDTCTLREIQIASCLFFLVISSFLWMPAMMAATNDYGMVFAGSTLLATALVFLVRRGDTIRFLVWGEIAIVCGMYFVVFWNRPPFESELAKWGGLAANLVLVGYLAQALVMSRKSKIAEREAAERAVQEQKMAALGELAGGVAHDFNNTLTAVLGNIELSRELPDSADRQAALEDAYNAAKQAEAVVKQLLIYARKAPSFQTHLDLNHAVPRMMELAKRLIPNSVPVELRIHEAPLGVRVDEAQLMTGLINLVANAVDAMPEGGGLTIRTRLGTAGPEVIMADGTGVASGLYSVIEVSDTGRGISVGDIGKVVQPFHSTKSRGRGTGLGLPMVLGFARDHGGGLLLASSTDARARGTQAEIWLPHQAKAPLSSDTKTPPKRAALETA